MDVLSHGSVQPLESGGRSAALVRLLRVPLIPFSLAYGLGVWLRNARYDNTPSASTAAGVPVISIGNLTVGGTGKTPLVIETVTRLLRLGQRPAILTRGYGAAPGAPADEVLEFALALPDTPVVADPDRVAGAARAIATHAADVLVMDDGLQHRRLRRDLNIVLIDALDPWGGGWLLPAGRLREPLSALARAGLLIVTRCEAATPAMLADIEELAQRLAPLAPLAHAHTQPVGIADRDGAAIDADELTHCGVLPVTALGNPLGFERLVAGLAGRVARPLRFRDHHRYAPADVRAILAAADAGEADAVVTSRKDWVKLSALWPRDARLPLWRLDVCTVLDDPHGHFDRLLSRSVARR